MTEQNSNDTAPVLGQTKDRILLDSHTAHHDMLLAMTQQAKKSIKILTHDLDPRVFDSQHLEQAMSDFATRSRFTHIQIVILNTDKVVSQGHRLVTLARRLTSHISIRVPAKIHKNILENYCLFDDQGCLYREHPSRYEGWANFYDALRVKELTGQFDEIWEMGRDDPDLRRLHI